MLTLWQHALSCIPARYWISGCVCGACGMTWRYKLRNKYTLRHPELAGIEFKTEWCIISGGAIQIRPGYAWDGCTPAIPLPFNLWIGTPDGPLCQDGRPAAYYASLVHDVLCQYAPELAISKSAVCQIFSDMLRQRGFSPFRASIYRIAVSLFGPQSWGVA